MIIDTSDTYVHTLTYAFRSITFIFHVISIVFWNIYIYTLEKYEQNGIQHYLKKYLNMPMDLSRVFTLQLLWLVN